MKETDTSLSSETVEEAEIMGSSEFTDALLYELGLPKLEITRKQNEDGIFEYTFHSPNYSEILEVKRWLKKRTG